MEMPKHTIESIHEKTAAAFLATQEEICRSHVELFVSLKITLSRLEKQIAHASADIADTEVDMDKLKAVCLDIKKDILQMQHALQNG